MIPPQNNRRERIPVKGGAARAYYPPKTRPQPTAFAPAQVNTHDADRSRQSREAAADHPKANKYPTWPPEIAQNHIPT